MITDIVEVSISTSVVIALALLLGPVLDKRIRAKGRYILWLILAIRLVIPFNITLPKAPVTISTPRRTVVLRTEGPSPLTVMDEDARIQAVTEAAPTESGDYAPVMSLEELAFVVWAVGGGVLLLVHLISYWRFVIALRPTLTEDGKYCRLRVFRSDAVEGPMLTGFFHPTIILPARDYTDQERDIILRHEYVHFRRLDIWYKLLLLLANAVHWFNPLVYMMVRRGNRDMEYACDDAVTKGSDIKFRQLYSMTILKTMKDREAVK